MQKGRTMQKSANILVIEDSASQAAWLRLILMRAGYVVQVESDGFVGWHVASLNPPDLMVLDLNLPTLNGFQILLRLKRGTATQHIPVIMLTRRDRKWEKEQALILEADYFLSKVDCIGNPQGEQLLLATVEHLLQQQRPRPTILQGSSHFLSFLDTSSIDSMPLRFRRDTELSS